MPLICLSHAFERASRRVDLADRSQQQPPLKSYAWLCVRLVFTSYVHLKDNELQFFSLYWAQKVIKAVHIFLIDVRLCKRKILYEIAYAPPAFLWT